jgi:uncharacterized membrane protein YidH (DUF202 family)
MENTDVNDKGECRVYRMGTAWKWLVWIFAAISAIATGFGMYALSLPGVHINFVATIILEIVLGGILLLMVALFRWGSRNRIEVDGKEIQSVQLFGTKRLKLEDIEGFRIVPTQYVKTLVFTPRPGGGRRLRVALSYQRSAELVAWANRNFKNLDAVQFKSDLDEMVRQGGHGTSPEELAAKLKQARKWCRLVNLIAIPIAYWGFIWPQPYTVLIWVLVATPLIGLLLLGQFGGLVRLDAKRGSAYPSVALAFMMGPIVLALRALLDWQVMDWSSFWEPFIVISLGLLGLTIWRAPDFGKRAATVVTYSIFCLAYGYGATVTLNGILATGPFTTYEARVTDEHIDTGKVTTYYFTLSAWGPRAVPGDVEVSRAVYERHQVDDTVTIYVRDGKFGMPYYFVR